MNLNKKVERGAVAALSNEQNQLNDTTNKSFVRQHRLFRYHSKLTRDFTAQFLKVLLSSKSLMFLPGSRPNGYLVRTCKFLAESYKAVHRLVSFSSNILQVLTI